LSDDEMKCERCLGTGWDCYILQRPCPDCNGTGEMPCFDGLREEDCISNPAEGFPEPGEHDDWAHR
jgi:hypothetical protein